MTFAVRVNCVSHPPQRNSAGRSLTPAMRTFEHDGQERRSSCHFLRVGAWSVRTFAPQSSHWISPRADGRSPLHFGHESGGGATLDSTVIGSSMLDHLPIRFDLFGDGQSQEDDSPSSPPFPTRINFTGRKFHGKASGMLYSCANCCTNCFAPT